MAMLDDVDSVILEMLQKNCRVSLTDMAREVNLSVDSVKKRFSKLLEKNIFYPKIQLRPRNFGFHNVVDIKIGLNNHSQPKIDEFINYLRVNPHVVELFRISGRWDLSIVLISKDGIHLEEIASKIKINYGNIIDSWEESLTLEAYKFEEYNVKALLQMKLEVPTK
jgi:DNA-binding Lrp family transcriptional regulator